MPENVPEAAPAATDALAGTVTFELLLASATAMPPAGAGALRETVQEILPDPVTLEGVQVSADSICGARLTEDVMETPAAEAVMVAV